MPKKILLADDSITIQKVVELTFSDGDYEVTAVNNGAKAVQKLAEMRPDIILSDIIMPEKNGYEVCEYVKSHPEFRNIPVVLLTGTFEPFDPDRAEKAGCDAVVTKPFESQSLIHKVEELIAQSRANSDAAPAPEPPATTQAVAPVEAASPWMDETPAAPEAFTHDNDIFGAAPPMQATTEMPFEIPPTPSFSNDSAFASPADTPFGEPVGEAFGGETRAFPRMSFEEMQQMASNATPPPQPEPESEPSRWQEPAPVTFDDFAPPPPVAAAPEPEPENDSPFGAPPPIEEFSSETRAFPRMSLEEMQQMTSGGISVDQPSVTPEPPPAPEPPAAASPWDEQDTPAFSGETRALPKLDFDDFQQQPQPAFSTEADNASPFATDDAPAFGGETRAFPKLSFDDFQKMTATPEPQPEQPAATAWDAPQAEEPATAAWNAPQAEEPATTAWDAPQAEEPATTAWDAPAAEEPADAFAESAAPFGAPFDEPAEPVVAPEPLAEVPSSFTDQPMPEDVPFAAEPVESLAAEEPAWSLPETAAEVAEAEAEPEEPAVAAAPAALAPEAPPMAIAARSADLTDEQVDRIARRVVELISDQVVRNIAWEVIPDLAEMVVKERIRQLEAEA